MIIIHDIRLPSVYLDGIQDRFPLAELFPFSFEKPKVYSSISCHPDIYFFQLDQHTLVHAPGANRELLGKLKDRGIHLIRGDKDPRDQYPSTVLYNAARVGSKVFLNKKHVDKAVLENIELKGLIPVDVSQGYARCSILAAGDNALITSDSKIAVSARKSGMEVLEISSGFVDLPGEKYGFIGGAGALTAEGDVVVIGDLRFHPQGQEIASFISSHNIYSRGPVFLKNLPLYDAGSLLFLSSPES